MAIYSYEGIGMLMPIMHASESLESFKISVIAAYVTLTIFFTGFSVICYLTWGSDMDKPIITEMLPADSKLVILTKLTYCVNLICSYAITINPANKIFEKWVFRCAGLKKKTRKRYWAKNF